MMLALLLAGIVALPAAPARAATQQHNVSLYSNFYSERVVYVSRGDTVAWTAVDQGHTVIADDNRFMFFPIREIDRGQQVRYTFLGPEETIRYYCRIHGGRGGRGMAGVVVVGRGTMRPDPPGSPQVRSVPSAEFPTIGRAMAGITPNSAVYVQPGIYRERVVVDVPGVALIGAGADPSRVVIDGGGETATGITLAARGATAQNLTAAGHGAEGIAVRGASVARLQDVRVTGAGAYGIVASESDGLLLQRAFVADAGIAAVMVKQCGDCGIIQDSTMERSRFGLLVDNAGALQVRRNTVRGNATGIAVRSLATSPGLPRAGVGIVDNQITDNRHAGTAAAGTEFAVRSGVWLAGPSADVVVGNTISGHDYGVLVTSFGVPSMGANVEGNVISGSGNADIAWDGIGAGVCFGGNKGPNGEAPTSRPPTAETLYPCGGPPNPGIPEPTVLADLALYAASANAPQ